MILYITGVMMKDELVRDVVEEVEEVDEWGNYFYSHLLNSPANYDHNKLLDVGRSPY